VRRFNLWVGETCAAAPYRRPRAGDRHRYRDFNQ
jgi:hypothetical protein